MLCVDRLRARLDYDPSTGVFVWKATPLAGRVAGSPHRKGYVCIKVDGRLYKAHRLAWLYVHGLHPTLQIDHINENPADNRISNLRELTNAKNVQNITRPRVDNMSGFRGVAPKRGRWTAQITVDGKRTYLGTFDAPEQANAAYLAAKRSLHPAWNEAT